MSRQTMPCWMCGLHLVSPADKQVRMLARQSVRTFYKLLKNFSILFLR